MNLIDDLKSGKYPVIAAPLAGYVDPPLVSILLELGAQYMIYPFISSEGLIKRSIYRNQVAGKLKAWRDIIRDGWNHFQLFGRDPAIMAEAAIILEKEENADAIDLNMGCSVKKVWKAESGSSLLKTPEIALNIVESVIEAVDIPVTLKTRTGWSREDENGFWLIRESAKLGIAAVTLHPRRGKDQWNSDAIWDEIKQIVSEVDVPIIGNGDIKSPSDTVKMLNQTGCNGVMIGRASTGNPWIFPRCQSLIHDGFDMPEPSAVERIDICILHIERLVQFRGEDIGIRESRKHVGRYLKGLPIASKIRKEIVLFNTLNEVRNKLIEYKHYLQQLNSENTNEIIK